MNLYRKIDDVASVVGVKPSTIKKYYSAVEKEGYIFKRNNQGQLIFGDEHIEMFRRIIQLKNQPGITVEMAIKQVVASITDMTIYKEDEKPVVVDMTAIMKELKDVKEFMEKQNKYIDRQEEVNKELLKELKATKTFVNDKLEEREKQYLLETQEVKNMIAAGTQNAKKWWKLFWK